MLEKIGISEWRISHRLDCQDYGIYQGDKFIVRTSQEKLADLIVTLPEALELLVECREALFNNDTIYRSCVSNDIQELLKKATRRTWSEIKELIK